LTDQQFRALEGRSQPHLNRWHRLVSSTNWEKGAIIVDWQKSMADAGWPKDHYSDDRWSQLAGSATSQHVGRLRRTFARFGHVHKEYSGLYWSHFYAALDWDDAEIWLEGAVQNRWTVSQMRETRWTTMGRPPAEKPRIEQIVISDPEEESVSLGTKIRYHERDYVEGPRPEGPDFGGTEFVSRDDRSQRSSKTSEITNRPPTSTRIRPFESFTNLPDDVSAAVKAFKIAIIKHKAEHWQQISLADMHGLLEALKALATAAAE
jgi:hypothetical protein